MLRIFSGNMFGTQKRQHISLRVFYLYLFSSAELVKGWASTIIIILFMGGVQLISLSVISEYLANMFNQVKKRPEYIIKNKII